MESQDLEYTHFNPLVDAGILVPGGEFAGNLQGEARVALRIGERTTLFSEKQIVYFLKIFGNRFESVIVPGVLVNKRYRMDEVGTEYSIVTPVNEKLRPSLEEAIDKFNVHIWIRVVGFVLFEVWPIV